MIEQKGNNMSSVEQSATKISKLDKMLAWLRTHDTKISEDIIETLISAKVMRESVSTVRIVGKTVVEVRDEPAFISAAQDFSDLTDVWNAVPVES